MGLNGSKNESIINEKPIYREPTKEDYNRLIKQTKSNTTSEEKAQIFKHDKADGTGGGYIKTHNYSTINSNMRNDGYTGNKLDADDHLTIKTLREAIDKCQLDDNYVFTRYVNADYLTAVFGVKGQINSRAKFETLYNDFVTIANPHVRKVEIPRITKELQGFINRKLDPERAFISVSALPEKNIMKGKPVILKIRAKRGTHCYVSDNRKESKCVFKDGAIFEPIEVDFDEVERKWIFTMDLIEG